MERHRYAGVAGRYDRLAGINMKIKVNIERMPEPYLKPTKPVKIGEVVPKTSINIYLDAMSNEKKDQARRRGQESRQKTLNLYTKEQEEQIIRMYQEGYNDSQIAEKLGRGKDAIRLKLHSLIKKYNIQKIQRRRSYIHHKSESDIVRRNAFTKAQDNVIVHMRMQGKTFSEIGDNLGKSKESVRKRYYRIIGRC